MNKRLPFVARIFWTVFAVVYGLVAVGFALVIWIFGEISRTDVVGTLISALILSYLVHLWLLPARDAPAAPPDDEP